MRERTDIFQHIRELLSHCRINFLAAFLAVFALSLASAYGDLYNEIPAVSPDSAVQGTTGLTVTFTLDSDTPSAPPAGILPQSVTIGSLSGSSITHASQHTVTALFDISAAESPGSKDVTVSFETPFESLVFSMAGGFTVTEAADTPPSITSQPQSQTVSPGSSVTFTVIASGTSPLNYQWQKDSNDISAATSSSYTIESAAYSDGGNYRCIITNDFGSATSDAAILTVDENAYAGTFAIVDTGQVICYDDANEITCPAQGQAFYGQDSQYTGNASSYTDNGNGTVTDNVTGLMWQQSPDSDGDGDIDAADKLTYDQAVAGADTLNLAGYSDWRLPTVKELYSLIDFRGTDPSGYDGTDTSGMIPFIDTNYFDFAYGDTDAGERIIDAQYASSNLYVSNTVNDGGGTLFGVNFADGRIKGYGLSLNGSDKTFLVIYVRENTSYGENNFSDNGDGTISDSATGLMWTQDDSAEGLNWEEALAWAETKNSENYLGYNDWRLPNVKELQGIVDYTRSPDTTSSAAIDPIFNSTGITNEAGQADYPCYWSGTTHVNWTDTPGPAGAYVAFGRAMGYMDSTWGDVHGAGAQRSDPKSGDPADWPTGNGPQGDAIRIYNYARLVRDLQCGEPGYISDLPGDINADCYVDFLDFAELSRKWLTTYEISDLALIIENWLDCIDTEEPCNYMP